MTPMVRVCFAEGRNALVGQGDLKGDAQVHQPVWPSGTLEHESTHGGRLHECEEFDWAELANVVLKPNPGLVEGALYLVNSHIKIDAIQLDETTLVLQELEL